MTAPVLAAPTAGPDDLHVWPASTARLPHGHLSVGGVSLAELADRYGTPLYLVDEDEVRARCRTYRAAFPEGEVVYAAKAFLSRAMARWVEEEGLGLDVCSAGELELAHAAGFPPERMVRVVPGVAAGGHEKIRTGTEDQKFGLSLTDGSAQHAIARVLGQPQLEMTGLHCHIGSQITDIKPYLVAVRRMVGLMARIKDSHGVTFAELDLGGGHGVAYRPGEPALDPTALARRLTAELTASCGAAGLPVPRLLIEPGRAIAAPAGVALYRVLAAKRTGPKLFVAVDGGMSDNPRPALYGARYAPRLIGRPATGVPVTATVVGRHCEAGDVLANDVPLPDDLRPGDLLAVPVAGAYQVSMASAYNLVARPPVVAVHRGTARLLIRRETQEDLRRRDVGA